MFEGKIGEHYIKISVLAFRSPSALLSFSFFLSFFLPSFPFSFQKFLGQGSQFLDFLSCLIAFLPFSFSFSFLKLQGQGSDPSLSRPMQQLWIF